MYLLKFVRFLVVLCLALAPSLALAQACFKMPKGPHAGKCLDVREKLSAHQLNDFEAQAYGGQAKGRMLVGNFFHEGRFYVASVPIDDIEDVIVQVEHFEPELVAAHTQLRFRFRQDVKLLPDGPSLRDVIVSVEYLAPPNVPYDLFKGLSDFALVHRILSLQTKFAYMVTKQHHHVDQYRLALYQHEKTAIFEEAIALSDRDGLATMYHTIERSCTTELFRAIDLGLDKNLRWNSLSRWAKARLVLSTPGRSVKRAIDNRMPVLTRRGLDSRGLLDSKSVLPELSLDPTL